MAETRGADIPPPLAVFVDPVHMLAAIHPLLALAALSPSAAVVAASNLLDLFSPAENPLAALVAFALGWEWASRMAAGPPRPAPSGSEAGRGGHAPAGPAPRGQGQPSRPASAPRAGQAAPGPEVSGLAPGAPASAGGSSSAPGVSPPLQDGRAALAALHAGLILAALRSLSALAPVPGAGLAPVPALWPAGVAWPLGVGAGPWAAWPPGLPGTGWSPGPVLVVPAL